MNNNNSETSASSGYPLVDIEYPGANDVLCGRGGHAISHSGNVNFRMLVESYKNHYFNASRTEKSKVTANVIQVWRNQTPPGRFLTMTDPSRGQDHSRWHDIGDANAAKKVAQCLREKNNDPKEGTPPVAAAAAAADPVPSVTPPVSVASTFPTPSAVVAAAPSLPGEWLQNELQQQQQRNHQILQSAEHHSQSSCGGSSKRRHHHHQDSNGKNTGSVAHHQQQHPKHQTQRQRQREKNAFKKQVQKQIEQAEQQVMLAQQQVAQQAQQLQQALEQRAQQEAAVCASQYVMNQATLENVQQEILKEFAKAAQQEALRRQHLQQLQQSDPEEDLKPAATAPPAAPVSDSQQDSESDATSGMESPMMWTEEDPQGGGAEGALSSWESVGQSMPSTARLGQFMPSAARLTKRAFADEPTNGTSSDSSTATSTTGRVTKNMFLDGFSSDTTSMNGSSNEDEDGANSSDTVFSDDGCNSVSWPNNIYAFPPDYR